MPNLDLPILVVDDAKFSSMVVSRTLRNAGYRDVRIANNARTALQQMEQRPVSVLIADWLMPEMDGLELTDQVRQQDEQNNHYTYVILLTARESVEALSEAFDRGVDDFIYKSDMTKQLIPRVFAADRMADRQNTLLQANARLIENNRELASTNIIDLETGLCNSRYSRQRLDKILRRPSSPAPDFRYTRPDTKPKTANPHDHPWNRLRGRPAPVRPSRRSRRPRHRAAVCRSRPQYRHPGHR
jgi:PleD family two-component response regulator|tara:strand:+ start:1378 stop:2106 length:729 start_codon:yes stop_codon:yes gene_type:complete